MTRNCFGVTLKKIIVCSFVQREFSKVAALKPAKVVKLVKRVWAGNSHLHHLYRLSAGQFRKPSARLVAELRAIDQLPSSRGRMFWKPQFFILVILVLPPDKGYRNEEAEE